MPASHRAPVRSLLLAVALPLAAVAGDWPRWLGPGGQNHVAAGPRFTSDLSRWSVAWKAAVGRGYSAVAVAGDRAYTLGHDGQAHETVFCLEAGTGREVWKHTYEAELMPRQHPGGPNATPTVAGDRVLTVGKDGQVFCLDAADGRIRWQVRLAEAMDVAVPAWGFASSPVVDGDRVLFGAGRVVALDLASGRVLWKSATAQHPGYATPVPFRFDGRPYIAAFDGKGLSVLDGADGGEVARHPYKAMFDMTATTPYVLADGGRVFLSGNTGAEMLAFDGRSLAPVWKSAGFKNSMNPPVHRDGVLYGIDGRQGGGRLVAVGVEDGKERWARPDFGFGNTIGVGDTLLALTENGELVAAGLSADGYTEAGRIQVLGKTCWTPPVYASDRIFLRNDRGDVVCLARK